MAAKLYPTAIFRHDIVREGAGLKAILVAVEYWEPPANSNYPPAPKRTAWLPLSAVQFRRDPRGDRIWAPFWLLRDKNIRGVAK